VKRLLKRARLVVRGALADRVIAVSDFVAKRKIEVDLVTPDRVRRIWNSREHVERDRAAGRRLREALGLGAAPIVACACRATPEKGVAHLLRAFDRYCTALPADMTRPTLIYFGDGPALPELRQLRSSLASADHMVLAGYRPDAGELLSGADVCVVPSVWQEAFGLAVLGPMTYGIPVIASRVGGIPEIIIDGETGTLVEPGDETGLETALRQLLTQPLERERMGRNARQRARTAFDRSNAIRDLVRVIEPGLRVSRDRSSAGRSRATRDIDMDADELYAGKR
jgi:glycosyltransferase involved in cell wall biosynthesis